MRRSSAWYSRSGGSAVPMFAECFQSIVSGGMYCKGQTLESCLNAFGNPNQP